MARDTAGERRSARDTAGEPMWLEQREAPRLWQRLVDRAQGGRGTKAAHALLEQASDAEVDECRGPSALSLITPVVRASSEHSGKKAEAEAKCRAFVELALRRGLSPDTSCPHFVFSTGISSPPLVAAASAGFAHVLRALLDGGADPGARDSDLNSAAHAALEKPAALSAILEHPSVCRRRRQLLCSTPNKYGKAPLVTALCMTPMKKAYQESAALLGPHVLLSDDDFLRIERNRRLRKLEQLAERLAPENPDHAWARWRAAGGRAATGRSQPDDYWRPSVHWSFPASDRFVMRTTYELARRGGGALPAELWLLVFSWVRRGWFIPPTEAEPPPALGRGVHALAVGLAQGAVCAARDVTI